MGGLARTRERGDKTCYHKGGEGKRSQGYAKVWPQHWQKAITIHSDGKGYGTSRRGDRMLGMINVKCLFETQAESELTVVVVRLVFRGETVSET